MPDIQRLSRKLASRKITLQELCQLYMASVQLQELVGTLSGYEGAHLAATCMHRSSIATLWFRLTSMHSSSQAVVITCNFRQRDVRPAANVR